MMILSRKVMAGSLLPHLSPFPTGYKDNQVDMGRGLNARSRHVKTG